jgi:hypothetical protein
MQRKRGRNGRVPSRSRFSLSLPLAANGKGRRKRRPFLKYVASIVDVSSSSG